MQDTIQPGLLSFPAAAGSEQVRASLTGLRKESSELAATLDYQIAGWLRRQGVVTVVPGIPPSARGGSIGTATLNPRHPVLTARGADFPTDG